MERCIAIHGHFYQPPRENPWLEEVEAQDGAYPYHDWNERISAECYASNASSRILNGERTIIDIINNYAKISFDFGPTLLSWMERRVPETYEAIIASDKESREKYGRGSAMACCYNHLIMPLATLRDKRTQVLWGMEDFLRRFKRSPEGMWLPETAVDYETLEALAENGIRFTLLSPHQAKRVRASPGAEWSDVSEGSLDTKRPYRCVLPSGRSIALFFYDGPISRDAAFGNLLDNGENFARRLASAFSEGDGPDQLVHIAADGETYGHHHRFGEMALSYCLYSIEKHGLGRLTNYAAFLQCHPPDAEVEIHERTSWSCSHGVERWNSDCGCRSAAHSGWTQGWRRPLRGALDWLRDNCCQVYEEAAGKLVADPWKLRDEYIRVILNRSERTVSGLFRRHALAPLTPEQRTALLRLCEMQRHALLMYTSCGWFFDDIAGIEARQVIFFAARAVQLAAEAGGPRLEDAFVRLLRRATGNEPQYADGAGVYDAIVKPAMLDMPRVGAHYAVSSLWEEYPEKARIYCYTLTRRSGGRVELGPSKLAWGAMRIRSDITSEEQSMSFIVLHLGDHNILAGLDEAGKAGDFDIMRDRAREYFEKSDMATCMHLFEERFNGHTYSLWHLFRDEQRAVLRRILAGPLGEMETTLRQLRDRHLPLMQAMRESGLALPRALDIIGECVVDADMRRALQSQPPDLEGLRRCVEDVRRFSYGLDRVTLGFEASRCAEKVLEQFEKDPGSGALKDAVSLLRILEPLGLDIASGAAQNSYFRGGKKAYIAMKELADRGNAEARQAMELFIELGNYLNVKITEGGEEQKAIAA